MQKNLGVQYLLESSGLCHWLITGATSSAYGQRSASLSKSTKDKEETVKIGSLVRRERECEIESPEPDCFCHKKSS